MPVRFIFIEPVLNYLSDLSSDYEISVDIFQLPMVSPNLGKTKVMSMTSYLFLTTNVGSFVGNNQVVGVRAYSYCVVVH